MSWWDKYQQVTDDEGAWWAQYQQAGAPPAGPKPEPEKTSRSFIDLVSEKAGVEVEPTSGLSAMERADLGLSDTFEERKAKFERQNPGGLYQQVKLSGGRTEEIYRRSPIEPMRMVDEPGVTPKDLLDRPQELVNIPAQAAIGLSRMFPQGFWAQSLMQAAVPGATDLLKQGIEQARGYQQQPLGDVLQQAGIEAGGDLAAGMLGAGIGKMVQGPVQRGGAVLDQLAQDASAIEALRRMEPGVEPPMAHQLRPDQLVLGRLAAQASSTSPLMKGRMVEQQQGFADMLGRFRSVEMGKAGQALIAQGRKAMNRAKWAIKRDFNIDPETAGQAIKGVFTDKFAKQSRKQINNAYKRAGALAEGVEFDLSGAQDMAKRVTAPVEATATEMVDSELVDVLGRPLTQEAVEKYVNVAASPGAKVDRVARLLSQIDPQQGNWEVVKELRSQVGEAIKDLPAEDATSGKAKALWRELTTTIENPIGGAPEFVSAWQGANQLARKRFEVFEQGRVLKILREDSPAAISSMIGDDPTMLTPIIRDVIQEYAPERKATIRKAIQSRILGSEGSSVAAIEKWQATNPNAYNFVIPNAKAKTEFLKAARSMDDLKRVPIERMLQSSAATIDRGKELLKQVGPGEIESTLRMFGGKDSVGGQAMRLAAVDDIIQKSLDITDGMPNLSASKLGKAIDEAKRSGVWEKVLTPQDKTRIKGLDAYVRRVFKSLKDTGTSLEQAQAIAALKHPSTFLQGVHALAINNRVLAPILVSGKMARLFRPRTGKGESRVVGTFAFLNNLALEIAKLQGSEAERPQSP